ncbi:MAG: VWA domain-containing protein [Bacteroidia bacterium]
MNDIFDMRFPPLDELTFAHPWFLLLLLFLPIAIAWYIFKGRNQKPDLRVSNTAYYRAGKGSAIVRLIHLPFILRCLTLVFIIIALARPQTKLAWQDMSTQGIDIVMAMDLSPSMLARDFKPNRLESAKEVAMEFIDGRPNDRIGLVVFSGEAFTQCPLTIDHSILKNLLVAAAPDFLPDGTAIGMGLATSVSRLKDSKAASKVVILITDGENNVGSVSPLTAAEIAQLYGIRVYTIGVGSKGMAYSPAYRYPNGEFAFDYVEVRIDEPLLERIAKMTDGQYFRATNNKGLADIYKKIDELEKTRFDVTEFKKMREEFWPFALLAAFLLLFEWFLRNTLLRSIP